MAFRISVDTGGTFTDVVIADGSGIRAIGKALTTPNRIFDGMRAAVEVAADWARRQDAAQQERHAHLTARRGRPMPS
jgi:N-methylhydantoinase A/oxoprolinase/acetone carboxylase beta subunit